MMKRKLAAAVLAAVITALLSSCSVVDTARGNLNEIKDRFTQKESDVPETADEIVAAEPVEQSNTFTVGVVDVDTWNPLLTQSVTVSEAMELVFDTLFEVNPAHEAVPVLASDYSISPDGRTVTVGLKQDVIWHDGRQFDAYDVVYTTNLIMGGGTVYGDLMKDVRECKMKDKSTVIFSLHRSVPDFVSLLTFPVIKYKTDMSYNASNVPIGTGPYSFYGKISTDKYMLTASDSYHNGRASIDAVFITEVPDIVKYRRMFEVGEIDIVTEGTIDIINGMPRGNINIAQYTSDSLTYVGFNLASPVLAGAATRRGISRLIDRDDIVSSIMYSKARASRTPINPASYLYYDTAQDMGTDYEDAYSEFEADGWEGKEYGFQRNAYNGVQDLAVHILVNSDNAVKTAIAENIRESLERFGVAAAVDKQPYDAYLWKINAHDYDMFLGETDIGHNNDVTALTGAGNYFSYESSDLNTVIAQAGMTADREQEKQLYIQLGQLLERDMPFAPLFFSNGSVMSGSRVKTGIEPTVSSHYRVANLWKTK